MRLASISILFILISGFQCKDIRNGRYSDAPPENVFPFAGLMNVETDVYGFSVETDVYGFGVVLVALLTGLSTNGWHQLSWGEIHPIPYFMNLERNKLVKIMDPKLEGKYPFKAAQKLGSLASMCLQYEPQFRPSMKVVVEVLERVAAAKWKDKSPG
ncbi:probable serine/threonine-protein kinase PIX13 [Coffea arabica]|uniref:Probable serine/threonine-protein kinase PIX13 n=1 Tax=Coffea arabica TaxID=13443 RepID=A0ABM4VUT4_COFAR